MKEHLIPCQIERGGFSSERTFTIETPNGEKLVGMAYVEYLRDARKRPLDEQTPQYGEEIDGFVVCRELRQVDEDTVAVEVPSSDLISVPRDELEPV